MSDIFLKLLNLNLTASWLIVAVIIFRLIARKTPKWIICLLWGIVAIRLICPFSIESSFSVIPSDEIISKSILSELHNKLNITAGVETVDANANAQLGDTYQGRTNEVYDNRNILLSELGVIWICGAWVLLIVSIIKNLRLRQHLKEAVLLYENIYLCDYVHAPFIFGFFRPHIYLPSGIDKKDMEYVILHEKAHLQRKDHIWKVIAFILLTIYWFNPLSWVSFILFCRDIELACDEKVIKNLSMSEKKAYSVSLLSCSFNKRIAIVYPLAFGEVGVKQRVKSILNYKKPTFWIMSLSFLACIIIGICFLTTSPNEYQNKSIISADASPMQVKKHEQENELVQMLLDYDKNNIVKVSVVLQVSDNEVTAANILLVSKYKIKNEDEQDKIKTFVLNYLNLDAHNINLEYADSEI